MATTLSKSELVDLLAENGSTLLRQGKKHEVWVAPNGTKFTVPRTLKGEGTLRTILKIAGIKHPKHG